MSIEFENIEYRKVPKHGNIQETYRIVLPSLYVFLDGARYKRFTITMGWWKWEVLFHFSTGEINPKEW